MPESNEGNPNIQIEVTDAREFHCFRLVLNPQSEPGERIEIMLHARSLVDLIHKCSLALCDWQAQTTEDLMKRLGVDPTVNDKCRVCGCTETTPCIDINLGQGCAWVAKELCSACASDIVSAAIHGKLLEGHADKSQWFFDSFSEMGRTGAAAYIFDDPDDYEHVMALLDSLNREQQPRIVLATEGEASEKIRQIRAGA
jgi:hypothetical protein